MSMAVASSEECLARAVRHVSDGWLPPQIEVLNTIQSRLNVGAYDNDRALLAKDLKEDFALYMYCLRELTSMLDDEQSEHLYGVSEQARETKHTPKDLIETSTIDKIRAVLSKSNKEISAHSFEEINEFQALRFRESMLSASTSIRS